MKNGVNKSLSVNFSQLINQINYFNKNGFIILKIFNKKNLDLFKRKIIQNLKKSAKKKSIFSINKMKNLEDYFKCVANKEHEILMDRKTRTLKIERSELKLILSEKIKNLLSYYSDKEYFILRSSNAFSFKGKEIKNYGGFRIVKSNNQKVAGYHSDHYNLQNFKFTMWVPLIGFDNKYSLKMIPKSHFLKHSRKQMIKNHIGSAQLVSKTYIKKFAKPYRPNLNPGEVILFHPYLIHGDAKNLGKTPRVSLEIRIGTE